MLYFARDIVRGIVTAASSPVHPRKLKPGPSRGPLHGLLIFFTCACMTSCIHLELLKVVFFLLFFLSFLTLGSAGTTWISRGTGIWWNCSEYNPSKSIKNLQVEKKTKTKDITSFFSLFRVYLDSPDQPDQQELLGCG